MAKWNNTKLQKDSRSNVLNDVEPPVPPEFTDIGATDSIDVGGVITDPVFFISGAVLQRADMFDPVLEESVERWPSRPRGATFEYEFQYLDPVADSEFIEVRGLTASASGSYVGYYPGLSSSTQVGKDSQFGVGDTEFFTIAGGVSLANTAYRPQYTVWGWDNSSSNTLWRGTVSSIQTNTNRMYVTVDFISREIQVLDPTQKWNIATTQNGTGFGGGGGGGGGAGA